MISRDYFSHNDPGLRLRLRQARPKGYCYKLAGENIGWNTYPDDVATAAIHKMFMDSSGHRANILGKSWDVIGVGAYKGSDGKKMWTVLFADKCGARDPEAHPQADAEADAQADRQADAEADRRSRRPSRSPDRPRSRRPSRRRGRPRAHARRRPRRRPRRPPTARSRVADHGSGLGPVARTAATAGRRQRQRRRSPGDGTPPGQAAAPRRRDRRACGSSTPPPRPACSRRSSAA